jgi:hypothetical protein
MSAEGSSDDALNEVCRLRRQGGDPDALAEEHARETKAWAHLAQPIVVTSLCAVCGDVSARVEIVAPGQMPAKWQKLPGFMQAGILRERRSGNGISLPPVPPPGTATVSPSTLPGPAGSPGRCGLRCVSPRFTRPGSTTMPDSAATATPPTAIFTGTQLTPGTGSALTVTARALTRTGKPASRRLRRRPDPKPARRPPRGHHPTYTAASGGPLADCRLLHKSIAFANSPMPTAIS